MRSRASSRRIRIKSSPEIRELDQAIGASLREAGEGKLPTDAENIDALTKTATAAQSMAGNAKARARRRRKVWRPI